MTTPKTFTNVNALSKHYIILDLDETLVHSFESTDGDAYDANYIKTLRPEIRERVYAIPERDMGGDPEDGRIMVWGVFRPDLRQFISFCCSYFRKVIIWSAGSKEYVHAIVKLFTKDINMKITILTKDDCYKSKTDDGFYSKPIKSIERELGINLENTFVCDDRDTAFHYNMDNGIEIPAYKPDPKNLDEEDRCLSNLQKWFMRRDVVNAPNVCYLDKPRKSELLSSKSSKFK